jgi:phosphonate transport system substrate-binding protein
MQRRRFFLVLLSCLVATALSTGRAEAADACAHRGALDPMYCDEDKDLVADVPRDKA